MVAKIATSFFMAFAYNYPIQKNMCLKIIDEDEK